MMTVLPSGSCDAGDPLAPRLIGRFLDDPDAAGPQAFDGSVAVGGVHPEAEALDAAPGGVGGRVVAHAEVRCCRCRAPT